MRFHFSSIYSPQHSAVLKTMSTEFCGEEWGKLIDFSLPKTGCANGSFRKRRRRGEERGELGVRFSLSQSFATSILVIFVAYSLRVFTGVARFIPQGWQDSGMVEDRFEWSRNINIAPDCVLSVGA